METIFLKRFLKDISKIEDSQLKNEIIEIIEAVQNADNQFDIPNIKKMKGYKSAFRIRVGYYRIGIFIEKDTVEFAMFLHRKDIYKFFP